LYRVDRHPIGGNVLLNQAIGYTLACIANIATEFGIQSGGKIEKLFKAYEAMQARDQESGALRVR
jgi:hypothetical protein